MTMEHRVPGLSGRDPSDSVGIADQTKADQNLAQLLRLRKNTAAIENEMTLDQQVENEFQKKRSGSQKAKPKAVSAIFRS